MTYKEALLKHLFALFDKAQDVRMKAMFAVLKQQLQAISEDQAKQIVFQAAEIIKKIEKDVDGKISSSRKK
jgi:Ca2+-binding EF-hand superfamily protein